MADGVPRPWGEAVKDANGRRAEVRGTTARAGASPTGLKEFLTRVFPERQLIFRSDGRVRLLSIPTGVQAVSAIVGICALGWAGSTLIGESPFEKAMASKV